MVVTKCFQRLSLILLTLLRADANPPRQTLEIVGDDVPSINHFWEFKPDFSGPPDDRPCVVFLHGNSYRQRNNPKGAVTNELSGARLFAKYPDDFELNNLPGTVTIKGIYGVEFQVRVFHLISSHLISTAKYPPPPLPLHSLKIMSPPPKYYSRVERSRAFVIWF
jgi:hypothetical protein